MRQVSRRAALESTRRHGRERPTFSDRFPRGDLHFRHQQREVPREPQARAQICSREAPETLLRYRRRSRLSRGASRKASSGRRQGDLAATPRSRSWRPLRHLATVHWHACSCHRPLGSREERAAWMFGTSLRLDARHPKRRAQQRRWRSPLLDEIAHRSARNSTPSESGA